MKLLPQQSNPFPPAVIANRPKADTDPNGLGAVGYCGEFVINHTLCIWNKVEMMHEFLNDIKVS